MSGLQNNAGPLRALFIGNSYTHFNGMPRMLERLSVAARQDRPLETQRITPGGCSLERHWAVTGAPGFIRAGGWDYVILQDHSMKLLEDRSLLYEYGRRFCKLIVEAGASPIFFMTWTKQHIPQMQAPLTEAYLTVARRCRAQVAPVGEAWMRAIRRRAGIELYEADNSHPSLRGSYLAACVFYATIYGRSPEGLPGRITATDEEGNRRVLVSLRSEEAAFLQRIAWQTAKAFKSYRSMSSRSRTSAAKAPGK